MKSLEFPTSCLDNHGIDMTLDKQACILAVSELGPVTFIHPYDLNAVLLMALSIADIATV